jgi:hypothetical protein
MSMNRMTYLNFGTVALLALLTLTLQVHTQVRVITIPDETERNHTRLFRNYDQDQRLSEQLEQQWLDTGAWANYRRSLFRYEDDGRTLIEISHYWRGGIWHNSTRKTETFDAQGNITSRTRELWTDDNQWVPYQRDIFTYNTNNEQTEWRSQSRTDDANWYYDWRFTYTYSEDGNILEETLQEWNRNEWILARRMTHSYNENKQRTETVLYESRGRVLAPDLAYLYSYDDENGSMTRLTTRKWTGNAWEVNKDEFYEYDEDGRLYRTTYYEYREPDDGILIARDTYNFDDEEHITERIHERRQQDGTIREEWRYIYTSDFRGYKVSKSYHLWQEEAWVEQYRTAYTYDVYGNLTSSLTQQ